jgi:hypothetical protein
MKLEFPVLLLYQQQCEKYATLLHAVVNNALVVSYILNICQFKVTNTTMD